jgi:hypothetical protein
MASAEKKSDVLSARVDPLISALVRKCARDLDRKPSYIVNMALCEMFRDKLPPGFKPGIGREDEE